MTRQRTIKETTEIEGIGLQTGRKTRLVLKSSPADSGINFIRTDLPDKPLLAIKSFDFKGLNAKNKRRTSLSMGPMEAQTIEHLMAALSGLSVDNIIVEADNAEFPGLDGSARDFVAAIKKAGIIEQDSPKKILKVTEPVWCRDEGALLAAFPDDVFRISYTLSYKSGSIGTQYSSFIFDREVFEKEIAPARTFCLEEEAAELLRLGLGKGANYENTLVMGKAGPVKNVLRFPDEPVRHKILDLVGDLYLLGRHVQGHIVAIRSGHRMNMELVRQLKAKGREVLS